VRVELLAQAAQPRLERAPSGRAEDVADEEDAQRAAL
jgi:hypothetical protein